MRFDTALLSAGVNAWLYLVKHEQPRESLKESEIFLLECSIIIKERRHVDRKGISMTCKKVGLKTCATLAGVSVCTLCQAGSYGSGSGEWMCTGESIGKVAVRFE